MMLKAAPIARAFMRTVLPLVGRLEIVGVENLGPGGRLLVSNHTGWADPIWIACACYPRVIHQMAKQELFRVPWIASVLIDLGAFPVDRDRPSSKTIKHAVALLKQGEWLLIFPTGTRDQNQTEARRGAALIASLATAPIVPVHYSGPREFRLADLFLRPRVLVRFGPPIAAELGSRDRQASADLTRQLDEAIHRLSGSSD